MNTSNRIEKIINGVLMYQLHTGDWYQCSIEDISKRLVDAESELAKLTEVYTVLPTDSSLYENHIARKLSDYDVWYEKCSTCEYDTGKSTVGSSNTCWKCGHKLTRDYSIRALKKGKL